MRILIIITLSILMATSFCACNEYGGGSVRTESRPPTYIPEISYYDDTPRFVEKWFYREFSDVAEFPVFDGENSREIMNAVIDWVDGYDETPSDEHEYQTTGYTVVGGEGDSSSIAWLCFHAGISAGIDGVSVELARWLDGGEKYVCMWRYAGINYVIDSGQMMSVDNYFRDGGWLVYGFDGTEYWTYMEVQR